MRPENKQRNEYWLNKLAVSLKNFHTKVILPAVLSEGLGVFCIEKGKIESLDFEWISGGIAVRQENSRLNYDLNFRAACVGETFQASNSPNLIVVDGQGFMDSKVWLGQCRVVKNGRTKANYMAYPHAFTPEEGCVSWLDECHERFAAMQMALTLYVKRGGFEKISLGLSGGLDSAVVAALAVSVVGAENVNAYILPSRFTSTESFEDAAALAKNLGLKLRELPIMPAVDMLAETASRYVPYWGDKGLMQENLQARVRGLLLMSLSNADHYLVLNTGNKS